MIKELSKLFSDVDYFAECCANIKLMDYESYIRHEWVNSINEQSSGFTAIPKSVCNSAEIAISVLFLFSLHKSEEWDLDETLDVENNEWKEYLKTIWIPEWFTCTEENSINYVQVEKLKYLSISDKILDIAFMKPIITIVCYENFENYGWYEYICETETEYIMFWSGTSA